MLQEDVDESEEQEWLKVFASLRFGKDGRVTTREPLALRLHCCTHGHQPCSVEHDLVKLAFCLPEVWPSATSSHRVDMSWCWAHLTPAVHALSGQRMKQRLCKLV